MVKLVAEELGLTAPARHCWNLKLTEAAGPHFHGGAVSGGVDYQGTNIEFDEELPSKLKIHGSLA